MDSSKFKLYLSPRQSRGSPLAGLTLLNQVDYNITVGGPVGGIGDVRSG